MPAKLQYCVYVLLSMHDGDLYVGFTTDLQRRLTEHFHGESKATAPRRPFRLIFPVRHSRERREQGAGGYECFFSKEDAERREGYLKTTAGRKGLKLTLREALRSRVWD
jgi:predicted GIY-YIG superfamily endonuclease